MTFLSGRRGNIAVEYGIIISLWFAIVASLFVDIGHGINTSVDSLSNAMEINNTHI